MFLPPVSWSWSWSSSRKQWTIKNVCYGCSTIDSDVHRDESWGLLPASEPRHSNLPPQNRIHGICHLFQELGAKWNQVMTIIASWFWAFVCQSTGRATITQIRSCFRQGRQRLWNWHRDTCNMACALDDAQHDHILLISNGTWYFCALREYTIWGTTVAFKH